MWAFLNRNRLLWRRGHSAIIKDDLFFLLYFLPILHSYENLRSIFTLSERDYATFGSLLSQIRLSSVTFVRPTQEIETFGDVSSPFCTLAIFQTSCKILRRSSHGNPSVGGVKRKRGIATYVTFGYLISWWVSCLNCLETLKQCAEWS